MEASTAAGLLRAVRPRQWGKNVLVFAGPGAAGVLDEGTVLARTMVALAAFVVASAGTYLLNDVSDREVDAASPAKRDRPVASGQLPVTVALAVGVTLVLAAVGVAAALTLELAAVVGAYVVLTTAYSVWLKHEPVLDIAIVAAGFVLRAVAGAVATDLPLSKWFLIVTSFAALYVVASKRHAELRAQPEEVTVTRPALRGYGEDLLREIRFSSAAVAIAAYVLWAFENAETMGGSPWFELSIVPFVLAMYRYALAVHRGLGEAPEEVFLRDRSLLLLGSVWVVLFGTAVGLAR